MHSGRPGRATLNTAARPLDRPCFAQLDTAPRHLTCVFTAPDPWPARARCSSRPQPRRWRSPRRAAPCRGSAACSRPGRRTPAARDVRGSVGCVVSVMMELLGAYCTCAQLQARLSTASRRDGGRSSSTCGDGACTFGAVTLATVPQPQRTCLCSAALSGMCSRSLSICRQGGDGRAGQANSSLASHAAPQRGRRSSLWGRAVRFPARQPDNKPGLWPRASAHRRSVCGRALLPAPSSRARRCGRDSRCSAHRGLPRLCIYGRDGRTQQARSFDCLTELAPSTERTFPFAAEGEQHV
jgi:hypothetical protein